MSLQSIDDELWNCRRPFPPHIDQLDIEGGGGSGRDLDQIQEDISNGGKMARMECQEVDEDLPGAGQHFVDEQAKQGHQKTEAHNRRLQLLEDTQHTQRDAEKGGGGGHWNQHGGGRWQWKLAEVLLLMNFMAVFSLVVIFLAILRVASIR